ncbi:MAG: hypothetical protein ACXU86_01545 [Archangium sp.]
MIRKTALAIVAALAVPAAAFASEGHAEAKAVKTQHSVVLASTKTPATGDAKMETKAPIGEPKTESKATTPITTKKAHKSHTTKKAIIK